MKKLTQLKPLKNLSLVDKVELRLLDFFKENKLVPGDSIPKEMEFAEALGVSRTVIREAVLRLRTLGLVESKKHRGMILTQPDFIINFERILDSNLLGDEALKDIFELRLILEMGMADLLFARKTDEDITELNTIVTKQEQEETDTTIFSLENEIAFHGKLYRIAKNNTLQRFQELLLPVFKYVNDHKLPNIDYEYSQQFVTHRDLINHLKEGTPDSFRMAMRQHLEPHFDKILGGINDLNPRGTKY